MSRSVVCYVSCFLSLATAWGESPPLRLPTSASTELVVEELLPTSLPAGEAVPLFFHRMPSSPPRLVSRQAQFLFADETLLPPTTSVTDELAWMTAAGATAVCQDGGTAEFAQAVPGTGLQMILMVNMSPLWLAKERTRPDDTAGIIEYLKRELAIVAKTPETVLHHAGRPVLWVFDSIDVPAEEFAKIRQALRAAAFDPYMLFQTQLAGRQRNPAVIEAYLRVFDGVFIWGGDLESTRQMLAIITPIRTRIQEESGVRKALVVTAKNGHWRVEKGSMIRPRRTAEFRSAMELAYGCGADAVNIESWNDFSENHQIQPSMANSTVFADLCRYYGGLGSGRPIHIDDPGIYVSHRRELLQGELFSVELLHLPTKGNHTRQIVLRIHSGDGREVFESRPWSVKASDAKALTVNLPTAALDGVRTLVPTVFIDGVSKVTGTSCTLRNGRVMEPFSVHSALSRVAELETLDFTIGEAGPGNSIVSCSPREARIHVESQEPIERLEILKNGAVVFDAAADERLRAMTGGKDYHTVVFRWDTPSRYRGESPDFSGLIEVSGGRILEAFLIRQVENAKVSETRAKWTIPSRGRGLHNGVKIPFTGDDATTFHLQMPAQREPLSVRWQDIQGTPHLDYPLQPHARLRIMSLQEPAGYPQSLGRENYSGTVRLTTGDDLPENTYVLRVTAPGAKVIRSLPIYVRTRDHEPTSGRSAVIWDSAIGASATARNVRDTLAASHWTFDADSGRMERDSSGWPFPCEFGGSYRRDGRFDPDSRPVRVPGKVGNGIAFDGNDVCHLPPGVVPHGTWYLDMWVKVAAGSDSRQTLFFNGLPAHLAILPDGRLWMRYGDHGVSLRLTGRTALQPGKWHRVTFLHDLHFARLFLDTHLEAEDELIGLRDHIAYYSTFGAVLSNDHMSGPGDCFEGILDDVWIGPDLSDLGRWATDQTRLRN